MCGLQDACRQTRSEAFTCVDPTQFRRGFYRIGIKSTCFYCPSTIEAGELYGGNDCELDRFYWKQITFYHSGDTCGLPGPFPGRTSRQWLAAMDEPTYQVPGGIPRPAYQQLLKHCGAAADHMLHNHRFAFSGRLVRCKPSAATLLKKAPAAGWRDRISNRFPCVGPPLRQGPDFQRDDNDVARAWFQFPLDIVDATTPQTMAKLMVGARDALGMSPEVSCTIRNQMQRTETRVALLWSIWRSRRVAAESIDVAVNDVLDVLARVAAVLPDDVDVNEWGFGDVRGQCPLQSAK